MGASGFPGIIAHIPDLAACLNWLKICLQAVDSATGNLVLSPSKQERKSGVDPLELRSLSTRFLLPSITYCRLNHLIYNFTNSLHIIQDRFVVKAQSLKPSYPIKSHLSGYLLLFACVIQPIRFYHQPRLMTIKI